MSGSKAKSRELARDVALQAIRTLYLAAVDAVRRGDYELARRLVAEADETRRVMRLRKPRFLRRGVCRNCSLPLVPGVTARYRLVRDGSVTRLVVTCLACGYIHRHVLVQRRRGSR
ncbi:ribonuclease P protein component 4 [Hyperthermus butylicus]|uniref:Ribonuclease P protein component 4 n=1 Tax=Hyperthermus butylicus (strain DSM 5456 / JCM 9403 / PLM1-5) TaxID=415426 RepID=RNP4_HYPBU|nr:ribonuclease P [Hyperthermus butylicus]A2BN51.1 RecName: Full=Ribonuclease P protein component 4; Short=RNase P component 4; AltName: Full=Rpp21 [Hyperthermus butylicus DSM 5456]ABM81412.1 conserved archaeal protein [Hyperthermus butylicus DSM 5456]